MGKTPTSLRLDHHFPNKSCRHVRLDRRRCLIPQRRVASLSPLGGDAFFVPGPTSRSRQFSANSNRSRGMPMITNRHDSSSSGTQTST